MWMKHKLRLLKFNTYWICNDFICWSNKGIIFVNKKLVKKIDKLNTEFMKMDPKLTLFEKGNPWLHKNKFLLDQALKIHYILVNKEKYDPNAQVYYDEIDRRMYQKFGKIIKRYISNRN